MTINEYIANPMGKGSTVVPNPEIKEKLKKEYNAIKLNMGIKWYVHDHNYICHVKMPSNSQVGLYYDIILEFSNMTASGKVEVLNSTLSVYSNSPTFIYTYANVFYNNGLICSWLDNKLADIIKTQSPTVRNRYNVISYEKSLYLAMLLVIDDVNHPDIVVLDGSFEKPLKRSYTVIARTVKSTNYITSLIKNTKNATSETNKSTPKASKVDVSTLKPSSTAGKIGVITKSKKSGKVGKVAKTKKVSKI